MKKMLLVGLMFANLALVQGCAFAKTEQAKVEDVASESESLKVNLLKKFTELPKDGIVIKTGVTNLYSYEFGSNTVYFQQDLNYLIVGNIIDGQTKTSLKEIRLTEKRGNIWSEIDFSHTFKKIYGKGEREMLVFFDPDCFYCQKLYEELNKSDAKTLNLTVHFFMYPLPMHEDAMRKSVSIVCSKDPEKTFSNFIENKIDPGQAECKNYIKENIDFGVKKQIMGTPAILFKDNFFVNGTVQEEQLLLLLKEHS